MTITVEAVYENGVLKPVRPLPLREREKVEVLIRTPAPARGEPTGTSPEQQRQEALDRLLASQLPVAGWEDMEQEIIRGATESMSTPPTPRFLDTAIPMLCESASAIRHSHHRPRDRLVCEARPRC